MADYTELQIANWQGPDKLTRREELFCAYYVELAGNITQAALKAGYGGKTTKYRESVAYVQGHRMLARDRIRARIQLLTQEHYKKDIASLYEVVSIVSQIARGDITDSQVVNELQGDGTSRAKIIDVKASPRDREKAGQTLINFYSRAGVSGAKQEQQQEEENTVDHKKFISVQEATLKALKDHIVDGFDDEIEEEKIKESSDVADNS